jgi:hypothetical protein
MDEDNPTIDDIRVNMELRKLDQTIQFARLRCLSPEEIIDRIAEREEGDDANAYVYRLSEVRLADDQIECLVDAMNRLARRSENAPSKLKARLDRTILRLVRLLPSDLANHFTEPFLDHPRKARREWVYSALREKHISQPVTVKLLEVFQKTGDQEALQLIARNPERVSEGWADFLLENLDEEYWRARVLEALLLHDRETALLLSHLYPIEFAHAVGRTEDQSLLDPLCELFDQNRDDLEFLSIYAYALGKIGGEGQLQSLEEFVASTRDHISDKSRR